MKKLTIFLMVIFICGCSTLSGINRLKELSLNRDEQQAAIKKQEEQFKQLLKDFSSGKLEKGASQNKIMEIYGQPVITKKIKTDLTFKEELTYRHPAQFFGSEKIFLYFDSEDRLTEARYEATENEAP